MAEFNVGEFSKHIKTTRVSSGLTMSVMAKATGISKATISRVENRHYPDVVTFLVLCKWAGLNPEWYLEKNADMINR